MLSDTVDALTPEVRAPTGNANPPKRLPIHSAHGSSSLTGQSVEIGPHIVETAIQTTGPISTDRVAKIMRLRLQEFLECYELPEPRRYRNSGEVQVRIEIDRTGRISAIRDTGSIIRLKTSGCIARSISKMAFPAPKTGEETVDYSFRLWGAWR